MNMPKVIVMPPLRLLRTPKPQPRESLPGYVLRLTEENSYDSPRWIPERAGLKVEPSSGRWADLWGLACKMFRLREITGLNETELESLRRQLVPNAIVRLQAPKICPPCLEEENWCRKAWDVLAFTACPKHRIVLIDHCPHCSAKLSWARSSVSVCTCGYDWRRTRVLESVMDREVAYVRRLAHLWYGDQAEGLTDEEVGPHPLGTDGYATALCALIDAWLYLQNAGGLNSASPNRSCHEAATVVATALDDWPEGFFRFCDQYDTAILRKWRLGWARSRHNTLQATEGWLAIAGALDECLEERCREDGIGPAMLLMISKEEVARKLDLSIGRVDKLIELERLRSVAGIKKPGITWIDFRSFRKLAQDLHGAMSSAQAAFALGIGLGQMRDLVRRGLLIPDTGPDIDGQVEAKFSSTTLEGFSERVQSLVTPPGEDGEYELVHLGQIAGYLMQYELSFGQLMEAVFAGFPLPVIQQPEVFGKLSRFWFRVEEFNKYLDLCLGPDGQPKALHYAVPSLRRVVEWLDRRQSEIDRFYRDSWESYSRNNPSERYVSPHTALQLWGIMEHIQREGQIAGFTG
jgi:TniQ